MSETTINTLMIISLAIGAWVAYKFWQDLHLKK